MSLFETARDQTGPHIIQLSLFLRNRVGALMQVLRTFETHNIHLCAISILDSADHAVVRVVVDRPDMASAALREMGHEVFESELLGVEIPTGTDFSPKRILAALLMAELNVHYMYSLIVRTNNHPVLVLHVDDIPTATQVLQNHGLNLVGQDEVMPEEDEA